MARGVVNGIAAAGLSFCGGRRSGFHKGSTMLFKPAFCPQSAKVFPAQLNLENQEGVPPLYLPAVVGKKIVYEARGAISKNSNSNTPKLPLSI
jgi:hypothetical protein